MKGLVRAGLGLGLSLGLGACTVFSGGAAVDPPGAASRGLELDAGYYWQSATGHLALLRAARPVEDWLADAATPAALRERLALAARQRAFAVQALHLPDNASYRRYADVGRPSVVWNVVAAPPHSLQLKTWCFPVLGCVGYRGYFDAAEAEALGRQLRAAGWEVSVYGVPAYSTLGKLPGAWFADPLLNTFIRWPEGELARLVFHELAHQVAYADDDTTFNESFATAVERLGARAWLAQHGSPAARDEYERIEARRRDFRALTLRYRAAFEQLYREQAQAQAQAPAQAGSPGKDEAAAATAKAALLARLRADHATLKAERWGGYTGYDRWFAEVNNAALGVLAAYNARVGAFEALFEQQGRDYPRFYAEVRRLAALPRAEREAVLDRLAPLSAPTSP